MDWTLGVLSSWPAGLAVGLFSVAYIAAIIWTGIEPRKVAAPFEPPPMPTLTPAEAVIYERTRLAQMRAEEQRALDAEEQARSSREFHRALDAYTRFERRAPPPLPSVGQAHLGTPGAAVFGIDAAESFVAIDLQNFGQTPARDVTYKTLTGWFPQQPREPIAYESEGGVGITDPGHVQHIKLILKGPLRSALIRRSVRGGEGFYVLASVDYTTENGTRKRRKIAYYLDLQGQQLPDRWMLSVCPTGNDELDLGIGDPTAYGDHEPARDVERTERRRALIKMGRDLAFGYCHGDREETFREYLEGQRGYADIRPHLSEGYRGRLEAVRMVYADPDGAKYPTLVQWFLDELDRLEMEWGLI
ncbi:MAG TPA: hypothetical protein VF547_02310 [Allosphingosinicella sp.]